MYVLPKSKFILGLNEERDKETPTQVDHKDVKFIIKESNEESKDLEKADSVGYNDCNERALHKIISNTLKYYEFNDNYTADVIMRLYAEHDLIKLAGIATNEADPRTLNSIIDMGEYPIAKVFNKKSRTTFDEIQQDGTTRQTEKEKKEKYSDLTFLPPRPNKYLDVITYSECSPNFEVRDDQIPNETLRLSDADRDEFLLTITQTNKLLKPLRGKVALYDRLILFYLLFGLVFVGAIGVFLWIFLHFAASLIIALIYFLILASFVYISKKKSTMLIKKAHL